MVASIKQTALRTCFKNSLKNVASLLGSFPVIKSFSPITLAISSYVGRLLSPNFAYGFIDSKLAVVAIFMKIIVRLLISLY